MGVLLDTLVGGPLRNAPGYKPVVWKPGRSALAQSFGASLNAVNRPGLRLPPRTVKPYAPIPSTGITGKFSLSMPYSSQPPSDLLPLPPNTSPSARQGGEGDIFGNLGAVIGDVFSGTEANLGNFVPFLAERPAALATALSQSFAESLFRSMGMAEVGKEVAGGVGTLGDVMSAPVRFASQVADHVANWAPKELMKAQARDSANLVRVLADPTASLDAAAEALTTGSSMTRGMNARIWIANMRRQGMSDGDIRKTLFEAANLPAEVKRAVVADPKVDPVEELARTGRSLSWAYGTDAGAQAANMAGDIGMLALEFLLTRRVGLAAMSGARGAAAGQGATAAVARTALAAGSRVAPVVSVGAKVGRGLIGAGTAIYATTKVGQAIAKTVGNQEAYDFLNRTLWTRPISDDPATAFVSSLLFTGLEGFSFLGKLGAPGARAFTRAAMLPARAIGKAVGWTPGRRLGSWEELVVDRLSAMYDPTDAAKGRAYVERYYAHPVTDAAGGVTPGEIDHALVADEVVQTAIDIQISRLSPAEQAMYSTIADGVSRTRRFVADYDAAIVKIIRDEPAELVRRWRNEAWTHRMGDIGVGFAPDAAGYIARGFHEAKVLTYRLRNELDSVVGLAEHVTPEATAQVRREAADLFGSPTALVPNRYLTDLVARMPGFRHAMRDVRDAVKAEENRVLTNGGWTKADLDRALAQADLRYGRAMGLGRRDIGSPVRFLRANAPRADVAAAVGVDEKTLRTIMLRSEAPLSDLEVRTLMDYLEVNAGMSREAVAKMSADEVRAAARKAADDITNPLYETGRRIETMNRQAAAMRTSIAEARAAGNAERAKELEGQLANMLALSEYVADPTAFGLGTFAREVVKAKRQQRLADILDGYTAEAERYARVTSMIDELETIERELADLSPTYGDSIADMFWQGRYVGPGGIRFSESTIGRLNDAFGWHLDGADLQKAYATIHGYARSMTTQDLRRLASIVGGKAVLDRIRRSVPAGIDEIAGASNMSVEDFLSRVLPRIDRRAAILDQMDVRSVAEAARIAEQAPTVPVRTAEAFVRRLERETDPTASSVGGVVPLDPIAQADLDRFRDPNVDAETKAAIMRRWGFDPERDFDLEVIGTADTWAVDDPDFRVNVHPRNVAELTTIEKGWGTGVLPDAMANRLTSLLDSDRVLAQQAAAILRRRGRLTRTTTEHVTPEGWVTEGEGPIDWTALEREDVGEILAAETNPETVAGAIAGEIDPLIEANIARTGDAGRLSDIIAKIRGLEDENGVVRAGAEAEHTALQKEWERLVAARPELRSRPGEPSDPLEADLARAISEARNRADEPPPPALNVDEATANRLRTAPRPLMKSYQRGREFVRRGGLLSQRTNHAVMAAPENRRGSAVLGTILWGSPRAVPNTIEGVLEALRDIENGTARRLGIGDRLLADAQRAADAIIRDAFRSLETAGIAPGLMTRGIRWADLAEADRETWARLMGTGLTITDPVHGLAYGLKKRPRAIWQDVTLPDGSPSRVLKKPGAVAMELEQVRQVAAESHVPGLVEEMLAGSFHTFEQRLAQSDIRHVYNIVFGPEVRPRSAYSRSPWGYVFGKLGNVEIGAFVREQFTQRMIAQGGTLEEADAVWQAWHDVSRTSANAARRGGGGTRSSKAYAVLRGDRPQYATIQNIPNADLDAIARKAIADLHDAKGEPIPSYGMMEPPRTGVSIPFGLTLREAASPVMRHLHDGFQIGGSTVMRDSSLGHWLEAAYNLTNNRWRTTIYPIFRFAMDVRFAAMEFIEPYALAAGRGAMLDARYTGRGLLDMSRDTLAHAGTTSVAAAEHMSWGLTRRFEQAYSVFEKERTPALEAEIAALRRESPELYAAARREALARRSGITLEDPVDFEAALRRMATDDPTLEEAIRAFDGGDTGAWLDELDAWHRRVVYATDMEGVIAEDVQRIIAQDPHLAEIASRIGEVNTRYWEDVRQLFWGKADRSRAERVLNHPLLLWPLSYQIRSSVWLGNMLFRRIGGVRTNALGAWELDRMMAAHNEALATDPEYRAWLDRHRNLLFVASMMFPITPDQVGVSLSPTARTIGGVFNLWDYNKASSVFAIGPIYTVTGLLPNVTGELWRDMRSWDALRESPAGPAVKAAVKLASLPYGAKVEWDAEKPPPPLAYAP